MGDVIAFPTARAMTSTIQRCASCNAPAVSIVFPYVDHRRRKPWPKPYGVCADHAVLP